MKAPAELATLLESARREQDRKWSHALGVTDRVLTPEEGAKWIEHDRVVRARNVSEARTRRGPVRW